MIHEADHNGTSYRVEGTAAGLKVTEFDTGSEPKPYQDTFLDIPAALVPWFLDAAMSEAHRRPLSDALRAQEGPSDGA